MDTVDCVVVGAGAVGLACARTMALAGRETIVLEAADGIGSETSSRNSEVVHAGLYYAPGSLKARTCVEGRRRLYRYLEAKGVPHARCGKLIVATDPAQLPLLDELAARGRANDVEGLSALTAQEARALEPALACVGALASRETGVFDSHGYMLALQGDLEAAGGAIAFRTRMTAGRTTPDGVVVQAVSQEGAETELLARTLVTNAGLHAAPLLAALQGYPAACVPDIRFAKGNYFTYAGRAPFGRLIYPTPEPGGLGVHVTLDLAGALRFGPDVEWVDTLDYAVDPGRAERFYAAVRAYWPGLPDGSILPGYAGIRPKLHRGGAAHADFVVEGPQHHGVAGLVNLLGVESPGLTASLALAETVLERLGLPATPAG